MTYMRAILREEGSPLFLVLISRRNPTCGDWLAAGDT